MGFSLLSLGYYMRLGCCHWVKRLIIFGLIFNILCLPYQAYANPVLATRVIAQVLERVVARRAAVSIAGEAAANDAAFLAANEAANGRELVTDKRQNALSKSSIKYIALIAIVIFVFSFYKLFTFFNPVQEQKEQQTETITNTKEVDESLNTTIPVQVVKPLSTQWRITGELQKSGKSFVILADTQGNLRLEPRSGFRFSGRMLEGEIDNQRVNYYSGVAK